MAEVPVTKITVDPPRTLRVYVMGESGVGRFSLLRRFHDGVEPEEAFHMHERVVSRSKQLMYDSIKWNVVTTIMNLTDCRMIPHVGGPHYVVMLVYDVTDSDSFREISRWLKARQSHYKENGCPVVMVATHTDMLKGEAARDEIAKHNYVGSKSAQRLSEGIKVPLVLTSAKDDVNITEAFEAAIQAYIDRGPAHVAEVQGCCCVVL